MPHPTQRGFAVLPAIFIVIALVAVVGVGYMLVKQPFAEETNTNVAANVVVTNTNSTASNTNTSITNTAVNTNTSKASNVFSYKTGRVGDRVAGMVITKIGSFNADQRSIEPNAHVEFSGEATVSGTVTSRFSEFAGQNYVCLDALDQSSLLLIPKAVEDTRSVHFCFTNSDVALKSFPLGTNKLATVTLENYVINDYPSEVLNLATFVAMDSTADWKTYTSAEYKYQLKHPDSYVASGLGYQIRFQKGVLGKSDVHSVSVNVLTPWNLASFNEEVQSWYTWAVGGFKTQTTFSGKRTKTLGSTTFTVFDFDQASGSSGNDGYFYVAGNVVYLFVDERLSDKATTTNETIISTFKTTGTITNPTADWKTFTNSAFNVQFNYPETFSIGSNSYGVSDPAKAEAFDFRKISTNYSGIPLLDISTLRGAPTEGQSLQKYAQSVYDANKAQNYTTTELASTSYSGLEAYEFGLQTGFKWANGGRLLDSSGGKVVLLFHGGKLFTLLQTGEDPVLENILRSIHFQ